MDTTDNQEPQKPKTLEVLSCTAEFYIATQGRNITAYKVEHLEVSYRREGWYNPLGALKQKAELLKCEVVTDVRQIDECSHICLLKGTGLILKTEEP